MGDADPLQAIADALRSFAAEEIVISTHPPGRSNWLARDIVERAWSCFALPVLHIVAEGKLAAPPRGAHARRKRSLLRRIAGTIGAAAAALVLALPGGAATTPTRLFGAVGPGFTITLRTANGKRVTMLTAGTYRITVDDRSQIHNFALRGPGVAKATSVPAMGKTTWTLTLQKGTYTIVCDPHAGSMRATFKVSAAGTKTLVEVNANSTTVEQMTAAFDANGVSNAARWAREVEEYRPYPTNDPTFAKLRQELSKYSPSSQTLALILASLTL